MAKRYGNFTDLVKMTRASRGTSLRRVTFGQQLIVNRDFSTDTWWDSYAASGASVSISGGKATIYAPNGESAYLRADILDPGKLYIVTMDIVVRSGSLKIQLGSSSATSYSMGYSGTYRVMMRADGTDETFFLARNGNVDADVDNVSVSEVYLDRDDGQLLLVDHPNDTPRLECDVNGRMLGMLGERNTTNLYATSNRPTIAMSRLAHSYVEAPDGTNTARLYTANSTSGGAYIYQYANITSGETYTFSCFVRLPNESESPHYTARYIKIASQTKFPARFSLFDLEDGEVVSTTNDHATITPYPNGWYRISATETATSSGTGFNFLLQLSEDRIGTTGTFDSQDIGDKVYATWGWQLEPLAYPTSLISTYGQYRTRAMDLIDLSASNFGYNQAQGTVYAQFDLKFEPNGTDFPRPWEIGLNGGSSERINIYVTESANRLNAGMNTNNVNQAGFTLMTNLPRTGLEQTSNVYGWADDNAATSTNGGTAQVDYDVQVTGGPVRNELQIFSGTTNAGVISGHMRKLHYYPRRLTNDQMVALSGITQSATVSLAFDGEATSYLNGYLHDD